ncbi:Uncharacterised protein [Mycobacteroides abscessus subsp. abscessus]|nr:Uncharacterised protein [Mycobacteroides abscessus subsp. abscessus]
MLSRILTAVLRETLSSSFGGVKGSRQLWQASRDSVAHEQSRSTARAATSTDHTFRGSANSAR